MILHEQKPVLQQQAAPVAKLDGLHLTPCPYLYHQDAFIEPQWQQQLLNNFINNHQWPSNCYSVAGRQFRLPRQQTWHADEGIVYSYSNNLLTSRAWTPALTKIRAKLEKQLSYRFNSVLVNYYRTGEDYVGWHSDDDKEMGDTPVIASVSLGATRDFYWREQANPDNCYSQPLTAGSLVVMLPEFQQHYQHAVLAQPHLAEPRINLTFRYVYPPK